MLQISTGFERYLNHGEGPYTVPTQMKVRSRLSALFFATLGENIDKNRRRLDLERMVGGIKCANRSLWERED